MKATRITIIRPMPTAPVPRGDRWRKTYFMLQSNMAKDTNFPIYKPVYELLQIVTRLTGKFDKTFKYTLGDKLSQEAK